MIHFVEKTWGIHYVMGGTGSVQGLVTKFEELGGKLVCDGSSSDQNRKGRSIHKAQSCWRDIEGREFDADVVCSNADFAHTYMN